MAPGVQLVVPEINPEAVREHKGIIANPNCSTIISITPLGQKGASCPLYLAPGVR